jgi:hypothetical protein
MTPEQFVALWNNNPLSERAGAQAHFDDLCDLLGVEKPRDPDSYCFERGAKKSTGGDGWADVWKRGHFGRENKKPSRDVNAAYGWPGHTSDMPDEEILRRLLALNLERVAASA